MSEKEVDIREDILNKEYREWVAQKGIGSIYPALFPEAYKQAAVNAMDENGKRMCLELLMYISNKDIRVHYTRDGEPYYLWKGEYIDREQLFENFL